jgi:hypothetical protein
MVVSIRSVLVNFLKVSASSDECKLGTDGLHETSISGKSGFLDFSSSLPHKCFLSIMFDYEVGIELAFPCIRC